MNEIEARLIALEAMLRITLLPLWKSLVPPEERQTCIDILDDMAGRGEDYYTNREWAALVGGQVRKWVDELTALSQLPDVTTREPEMQS